MTVKDLIQELNECNPNAEVRIGTYCGTIDGSIQEVSADQISPSNKVLCVYLACEITHYKGEWVRQTYTNGKNFIRHARYFASTDGKFTDYFLELSEG